MRISAATPRQPPPWRSSAKTPASPSQWLSESAFRDRKLTAILAADVVGYSGRMERNENGRMSSFLFEPEIARHHNRVFKLMGDEILPCRFM